MYPVNVDGVFTKNNRVVLIDWHSGTSDSVTIHSPIPIDVAGLESVKLLACGDAHPMLCW